MCSSHGDFTPTRTPDLSPPRMPCMCAVHSPPPPTPPPPKKNTQKEGLMDCGGGTSFITFDAVLLAVF